MTIPKKLKIGGHVYTVELVDRVETDKGEDNCGDCDWTLNKIRIKKSLPPSQAEETFFHEVLHALNTHMSEDAVNDLGFKLYQVLSDNNLLK